MIYSRITFLAISEFKTKKSFFLKEYFCAEELTRISQKKAGTVAGLIACKQAVRALYRELESEDILPCEIIISRTNEGAPFLFSLKGSRPAGNIFISISHSRETASACAAGSDE
ncbi:MAG: hypothetical protein A2096_17775 [Spirochaetes bacterium GWF1_41_5]|nr:MAG: hypothetical protein A2096_17775 [Spirochaetes bacterium GWF1_41_5]HBE02537.1 hypothetical protein [Spirochaetia bacterium]